MVTIHRRSTFGEVVIRSLIWTILALEYKLYKWRSRQSMSRRIDVGAQRWRLSETAVVSLKTRRAEGTVRTLGWSPEKNTEKCTARDGPNG